MDLVNIETPLENFCVALKMEQEGARCTIVTIKTVISRIVGKADTILWHALNKIGESNYTQWLSGLKLTFSEWNAGEPAGFPTKNCVGIVYSKN
jgi:hypothetical protein